MEICQNSVSVVTVTASTPLQMIQRVPELANFVLGRIGLDSSLFQGRGNFFQIGQNRLEGLTDTFEPLNRFLDGALPAWAVGTRNRRRCGCFARSFGLGRAGHGIPISLLRRRGTGLMMALGPRPEVLPRAPATTSTPAILTMLFPQSRRTSSGFGLRSLWLGSSLFVTLRFRCLSRFGGHVIQMCRDCSRIAPARH